MAMKWAHGVGEHDGDDGQGDVLALGLGSLADAPARLGEVGVLVVAPDVRRGLLAAVGGRGGGLDGDEDDLGSGDHAGDAVRANQQRAAADQLGEALLLQGTAPRR